MIIALLLMAVPAAADLSDGMWHSEDFALQVQFDGLNFIRHDPMTGNNIQCSITDWPLNSPVATAGCKDGTEHKLIIGQDSLTVDDIPMAQTLEAMD